ncbi:MAG: signal peptidase I, partial [Oscillospiraceae bacterium]|nr:signal peptidase I [Oscillospiraceae bacterium]
ILLVASFLSGAGRNLMTANSAIVAHNLWETGSIVILGELIRFKLIKSAGQQNRVYIIAVLTVVLAYGHMNAVRMLIDGNVIVWAVFFEAIFRPLVISAVLSYFAVEGTFKSVILVSFVYKMTPYVVPVLPDISQLVWALITCGTLFVTAVIYRFVTNEKRRNMKIREKRMLKYAKKPILSNAVTVVVVAVIIAFFVGMFPVYPVVILTGSMADTAPRGSLVFVERVPPGEAFIRVGEGEVIHFLNHTGVPYVHRVVDFRWDADGNREYVTRGDASDAADPFPVPQYDVLGIVRAQLPFFGYPYIFVRSILR